MILSAFYDSDIAVRRAAVFLEEMELHVLVPRSTYPSLAVAIILVTPNELSAMTAKNFVPAPPFPGEDAELETVRAAFEKWLKDHGQ